VKREQSESPRPLSLAGNREPSAAYGLCEVLAEISVEALIGLLVGILFGDLGNYGESGLCRHHGREFLICSRAEDTCALEIGLGSEDGLINEVISEDVLFHGFSCEILFGSVSCVPLS